MDWNTRWELLPEIQLHIQIADAVAELLQHPDKDLNSPTWAPVVDLPKLRPN